MSIVEFESVSEEGEGNSMLFGFCTKNPSNFLNAENLFGGKRQLKSRAGERMQVRGPRKLDGITSSTGICSRLPAENSWHFSCAFKLSLRKKKDQNCGPQESKCMREVHENSGESHFRR